MSIHLTWFHAVAFFAFVLALLLRGAARRDASLNPSERSEVSGGATIMLVTFVLGMIVGKIVP